MDGERVEFLEAAPADAGAGDVVEFGRGGGPGGPRRWWVVLAAAVVLVGSLVAWNAHRDDRADTPVARAGRSAAVPAPPTGPRFGLVDLPEGISAPWQLVAATSGDVVWMRDHGAGIVRLDGGRVTAVQLLERQVTALAVSPDGTTLYAAVAGDSPSLQEMNATTLALGASVPVAADVQSIAVTADAVWAGMAGAVLRLGLVDLTRLGEIPLPGVLLVDHLDAAFDPDTGVEHLTGVVSAGNGTQLLGIDTATGAVVTGADIPGDVSIATGQLLTWVSWSPAGSSRATTLGFTSGLTAEPTATTGSVVAGHRIYDGGVGTTAFFDVGSDAHILLCHDNGGFATSQIDLAATVPGATVTGPVLRTDTALYVVSDRGLVRTGVGSCT